MKRIIISLVIAIIAGLGLGTWSSITNVSACLNSPGCIDKNDQPKGKITTYKQGFPAPYRTKVKFAPDNNDQNSANYAGYAEATAITQNTNVVLAVMNVVFWFPILYLLLGRINLSLSKAKQ